MHGEPMRLRSLVLLAWLPLLVDDARAASVTFQVQVPHCTPRSTPVYLRSNRAQAASFVHDAMTCADATGCQVSVDVQTDLAQFEYKYSSGLCDATACPGIEKDLAFTGSGAERAPRTLQPGQTATADRVAVWRSALVHVDGDRQVTGLRSMPDELVAFCAPYLSVHDEDGHLAVGHDAYDAEVIRLDHGPTTSYGSSVQGSGTHRNRLRLDALTPGSAVHYRVVVSGATTHVGQFLAPPAAGAPFRMVALGDLQYILDENLVTADALVAQALGFAPQLAVGVGDLVNSAYVASAWVPPEQGRYNILFASLAPLLSQVPFVTAMGNHEEDGAYYWDVFDFPQPAAPARDHFFFRYGNALVIVLYTGKTDGYSVNGILDSQTAWLDSVLANYAYHPDVTWRIVALHRGVYSEGANHDDGWAFYDGGNGSRLSWRQLFTQYDVDLVLAGHNHNFTLAVADDVHFVTQCSGAPTHPLRASFRSETVHAEQTCSLALLSLDDKVLHLEARRPDGSEIVEARRDLCHQDADCDGLLHACAGTASWSCVQRHCQVSCVEPVDAGLPDASDADATAADVQVVPDAAPPDLDPGDDAAQPADASLPDASSADRALVDAAIDAGAVLDAESQDRASTDTAAADQPSLDAVVAESGTRDVRVPDDAVGADRGPGQQEPGCDCAHARGASPWACAVGLGLLALRRSRQRSMSKR